MKRNIKKIEKKYTSAIEHNSFSNVLYAVCGHKDIQKRMEQYVPVKNIQLQ